MPKPNDLAAALRARALLVDQLLAGPPMIFHSDGTHEDLWDIQSSRLELLRQLDQQLDGMKI